MSVAVVCGMYSHVCLQLCMACTVMFPCSFLWMCKLESNLQTRQEVSHGLSLNPLKILLLCVDED